jgi:hypothetical protein
MKRIGTLKFQGEEHDIFCSKVGKKYGLFVSANDKFIVGEMIQLEDTELRKTRKEAINELIVRYSIPGGPYEVTLL